MNAKTDLVNTGGLGGVSLHAGASGGVAQIRNVAICYEAIARTQKRHENLPGISAFYGPSGYGKSLAAMHIALRMNACYVQVKSAWTRKHFMEALLRELMLPVSGTVADMVDAAAAELARSRKVLIVDEFDYMVTAGKVELVRDIYESSGATILLIGEEMLPRKLERWERFHGRILNWMQAMPANQTDARLLVPVYCDRVQVADDLLAELVQAVRGSVRRVANNLQLIEQQCLENGVREVDAAAWRAMGGRIVTGESPKPRVY